MMIFLDIDGVLHPFADRHTRPFCDLPRFEAQMRRSPTASIVITSTLREDRTLQHLQAIFSPDIAARVVGVTPVLPIASASELVGSRYREILEFFKRRPAEPWVALDDDESLFPPGCPNLILCENGFDKHAAMLLDSALSSRRDSI